MATYSTLGVGRFIVANAYNTSGTTAGTVLGTVGSASEFQVKYINANGQKVCSDRITIDNVRQVTAKSYIPRTYRSDTISLASTNVVVGQEYGLKIIFRNWGSGSAENQYIKVIGGYVAQTGDDAEDIFDAIKANADLTFAKEPYPLLSFAVSGSGASATLVVTELAQPFALGKMQGRQLDYTILFVPITKSSAELIEWGSIVTTKANPGLGFGKEVADMEYFFLGEGGDIYRQVGFPYTFNTVYLVDSTSYYDIITITYFYEDEGVNVQKSEKQLYIVCKAPSGDHAIAQSIAAALTTAGLTVDTTDIVNYVETITVTSAGNATTIATDGGTLQMSAAVLPSFADDTAVVWSVTAGTGTATISAGGLLTAVTDGTVTAVATAHDGSGITGSKQITISNQA